MCVGCASTNVSVGAGNGAVAAYPSSIGNVNTPQFALGDLVAVDTRTKRAWKFGAVKFDPTEVAMSQTTAETSEPFDSSFDLVYSQNLGPVMQDQVNETVRGAQYVSARGKLLHAQHQKPRGFHGGAAPVWQRPCSNSKPRTPTPGRFW